MIGLDPLRELLDDPTVTEVMVNGPGKVWVERNGRLERLALSLDRPAIDRLIEDAVSGHGRQVDRAHPVVDTRLDDGSRVSIVVPPVAIDGPCVTIRRFRPAPVGLEELAGPEVVALLDAALAHRLNVIVIGAAGSGKTTVLNALLGRLDGSQRLITVEDAAELRIGAPHVVRLETRGASADGVGEVSVRDLVRAALRMRPDRIIVGEIRGAEAADMCQAMFTGHDGSMSTCHANGPFDALARIEAMVASSDLGLDPDAARGLIASAVDLLVWVRRTGDATREVVSVHELEPEGAMLNLVASGTEVLGTAARPSRRWLETSWWAPSLVDAAPAEAERRAG